MIRRLILSALLIVAGAIPAAAQMPWPTPPVKIDAAPFVLGNGVARGPILLKDGAEGAPSLAFESEPTTGVYRPSSTLFNIVLNGTSRVQFRNGAIVIRSTECLSWTNGAAGDTVDASVCRDAANTLAQRNGTNAQTYRWYHSFTDASNRQNGALLTAAAYVGVSAETAGTGADDVSVRLAPAGVGTVLPTTAVTPLYSVTTDSTAGALTYTAAMLKGGLILRDPNGAGRSDVTPTAALLLAALPGAAVGQGFEFTIRNTADAAETITVTAGTGATLSGTMTIAQNNSKRFLVVFTNVTAASEAYTLYSLGTVVH